MINAVFDLSNLFYRSMFIVGGFGKKKFTFDSERETDQLMRKVATDVSLIIRILSPSRVIFTFDSKSWRKKISIDENEGYKGNRKKAEHINWENVYKTMDKFSEIVESNGFISSKIDNAEADDLMALWAKELAENKKEHVIIISGDEDIRQLVSKRGEVFVLVYNPFTMGKNAKKKLFVPFGFKSWIDEDLLDVGTIFDRAIDVDKEDFHRILKEDLVVEEIDGDEIGLHKIFCGDSGDNVPAIYSWIKENGKFERITPSKYKKIVSYIGAKSYKDLIPKSDIIKDQIIEISNTHPTFKMDIRLDRQIKLVILDPVVFPKEINEAFKEKINEYLERPLIRSGDWNMGSMLEGTKYVDANYKKKQSEASIFAETDRISNRPLF